MTKKIYLILLLCLSPIPAFAEDFYNFKAIRCNYTNNTATTIKDSDNDIQVSIDNAKYDFIITFDEIDRAKGIGKILGNQGVGHVLVVSGNDILSFVEITPSGNINTTSIYNLQDKDGKYISNMSRHINMSGAINMTGHLITVSQMFGTCDLLSYN